MRRFIQHILRWFTQRILEQYRPTVVGITGSVGKTSTKDAVACVLGAAFPGRVRASIKSYNNQLGVPFTVIGLSSAGRSVAGWLQVLGKAAWLIVKKQDYPKVFVLEMGVDRPGDLEYLLAFVPVKVAVMTAVGEMPVHVEFFSGPEELLREKAKLAAAVPASGYTILNVDDEASAATFRKASAGAVLTYGFGPQADVRASNYSLKPDGAGTIFKLNHKGATVPVALGDAYGRQQVYAALAGAAAGIAFGLNLAQIAQALGGYQTSPGRLRRLKGIKGAWILDDSYNSSPLAVLAALEVLMELPAGRRIAVLGDMTELGKYTPEAHTFVGDEAAKAADIIFAVGVRARFMAEAARRSGMASERVREFDTVGEAGRVLQEILRPEDLVLVKGSQVMRMEKIVEEVMAEPARAGELLCRQDESWETKA
ncbi:UDP-N-acetylmuramoyl-tripeptide--D-alanyl-D-alanine ligase [Candidatus Parcubacteria bacterium]|nr:UDP-N-acetylmuramoyl-tripeptide--D-alanyl-D-alanine ligase [Candidatus Parcubacteria bacterium]